MAAVESIGGCAGSATGVCSGQTLWNGCEGGCGRPTGYKRVGALVANAGDGELTFPASALHAKSTVLWPLRPSSAGSPELRVHLLKAKGQLTMNSTTLEFRTEDFML